MRCFGRSSKVRKCRNWRVVFTEALIDWLIRGGWFWLSRSAQNVLTLVQIRHLRPKRFLQTSLWELETGPNWNYHIKEQRTCSSCWRRVDLWNHWRSLMIIVDRRWSCSCCWIIRFVPSWREGVPGTDGFGRFINNEHNVVWLMICHLLNCPTTPQIYPLAPWWVPTLTLGTTTL